MQRLDTWLWGSVITLWFVGDLATTVIGLTHFGLIETNSIAVALIDGFGLWILVPFKAVSVAILYALWRAVPRPYAHIIPVETVLASLFVVGSNTALILGRVG